MKKLIVIPFIVIAFIICYNVLKQNNKVKINLDTISDYLEIEISPDAQIEYKDKHDSFFKEGYTIIKIKDTNLLQKIKNSNEWKNNNNEYTSKISGIMNNMSKEYNEINKIKNYYWIYKNNYKSNNIRYVEDMNNKNLEINNYLVGIYDMDSGLLYYYHMDM